MQYVCHQIYNKKGACGRKFFIKKGETFNTIGPFISVDNRAICTVTSEDAYRHFARNDDGQGLYRGELTYFIAFSKRHPNKDNGYRFTDEEAEMLVNEYERFLVAEADTILFNYDFFNAEIGVLEELKNKLEVKK